MPDEFLTSAELAVIARTAPETVRYWRTVGRGPRSFKLPGTRRVLYARRDVDEWLASARDGGEAA